jgi:hypothetical protein
MSITTSRTNDAPWWRYSERMRRDARCRGGAVHCDFQVPALPPRGEPRGLARTSPMCDQPPVRALCFRVATRRRRWRRGGRARDCWAALTVDTILRRRRDGLSEERANATPAPRPASQD